MGENGFGREVFQCPPQLTTPVFKINDCHYSRRSESSPASSTRAAETPKAEVEAVNELVRIVVECLGKMRTREREVVLRKLFRELEQEASMERFIIERLRRSEVGAISELLQRLPESGANGVQAATFDSVATRGLRELSDESPQKLERFKLKTLHLGGGLGGDKNK